MVASARTAPFPVRSPSMAAGGDEGTSRPVQSWWLGPYNEVNGGAAGRGVDHRTNSRLRLSRLCLGSWTRQSRAEEGEVPDLCMYPINLDGDAAVQKLTGMGGRKRFFLHGSPSKAPHPRPSGNGGMDGRSPEGERRERYGACTAPFRVVAGCYMAVRGTGHVHGHKVLASSDVVGRPETTRGMMTVVAYHLAHRCAPHNRKQTSQPPFWTPRAGLRACQVSAASASRVDVWAGISASGLTCYLGTYLRYFVHEEDPG